MHELCYIDMLHRSVNFDFTHQLLLCSTSLQRRFLNYFGCGHSLVITLDKFITFGKSTLAEEFSFDILYIANFSILMLDSFFNYLVSCGACNRLKVCLTTTMLTIGNQALSCCSTSTRSCRWCTNAQLTSMKVLLTTIVIRHFDIFYQKI